MSQDELLGILRAVLTSAGGALVANGTFTDAQWQDIVGVVLMIGGAVWSYINKRQHRAAVVTAAVTGQPVSAKLTSPLSPQPTPQEK